MSDIIKETEKVDPTVTVGGTSSSNCSGSLQTDKEPDVQSIQKSLDLLRGASISDEKKHAKFISMPVKVETKGNKIYIGEKISIDKEEIKKSIENGGGKKMQSDEEKHAKLISRIAEWETINKPLREEEIKKSLLKFKECVSEFPKYLSHSGSAYICVLLSLKDTTKIILDPLPEEDRQTITDLLSEKFSTNIKSIEVRFDVDKDFIFKATDHSDKSFEFTMFNSIAHPNPADSNKLTRPVKVETKGNKIYIGGKISIDKVGIKKSIENGGGKKTHADPIKERALGNKRGHVSGRNAYEIRADILQMAIDWYSRRENISDDNLMELAEKFYRFVENKI